MQLLNTVREELADKYSQKPQLSSSHRQSFPYHSHHRKVRILQADHTGITGTQSCLFR